MPGIVLGTGNTMFSKTNKTPDLLGHQYSRRGDRWSIKLISNIYDD